MTEQQWLTSIDPQAMLSSLQAGLPSASGYNMGHGLGGPKVSERQVRLFACAWWRSIPPHYDYNERKAISIEETGIFSNSGVTLDTPQMLIDDCLRMAGYLTGRLRRDADEILPTGAALLRDVVGNPWRPVTLPATWEPGPGTWNSAFVEKERFRSCPWIQWNGGCITVLAHQMYDSRDFGQMPLLADMLEDASCDSVEVLNHCRGLERCERCLGAGKAKQSYPTGSWTCEWKVGRCHICGDSGWKPSTAPHVRGCWVIDLLLGHTN